MNRIPEINSHVEEIIDSMATSALQTTGNTSLSAVNDSLSVTGHINVAIASSNSKLDDIITALATMNSHLAQIVTNTT